jgi:hypothetical protein
VNDIFYCPADKRARARTHTHTVICFIFTDFYFRSSERFVKVQQNTLCVCVTCELWVYVYSHFVNGRMLLILCYIP